jgi:hypothetical protein
LISKDELDDLLKTSSTTLVSQISYIDEDDDLKFINSNKNLFNNTEQNVYIVCKYFILLKQYFFFII